MNCELQETEAENDTIVAGVKELVKKDADRYIRILEAKDKVEDLQHQLRGVNEKVKAELGRAIATKQEKLARSVPRPDNPSCPPRLACVRGRDRERESRC